ncbi:MAG TPA: hypothetical protein DCK95_04875 [Anaerolineaceae bacterium]|nr:hypothetical protein [Anaerolineaceae bacterium]
MEHKSSKTLQIQARHGFHILPQHLQNDTSYLENFITFAKNSATQYAMVEVLTCQSLPVNSINTLTEHGITVDVFLKTSLQTDFDLLAYQDLINNLANLHVKRLILFDRPNRQDFWDPQTWVKPDLLEIFLEKFSLLAEKCLEKNIQPVFPPLQPAGDFWDTVFLRLALQTLQEKGKTALLESLTLSAYAWTNNHPLQWGAGGPERWPASTPYYTPQDGENQQGFRIFDWYQANVKAVLNHSLPILLLQAGRSAEYGTSPEIQQLSIVQDILEVLYPNLYAGGDDQLLKEPIPPEVATCNFLVELDWQSLQGIFAKIQDAQAAQKETILSPEQKKTLPDPFVHYLLLPDESWQSDPRKAAALQPFLNKFHPHTGVSVNEALDASEVTLLVTNNDDMQEKLNILAQNESILVRRMRVEPSMLVEDGYDHQQQ